MKRILSTALGFSFLATTSAFAGSGYITANVNLRAGPDPSYPSVSMLRTGTPITIEGCVDGWSWCDVSNGYDRGWVAGDYLQEEYRGQRVMVPSYGVQIGIPIVSFVFGSYWEDHYRNRSWYGTRERWSHFSPQYDRGHRDHDYSHDRTHGDDRTHGSDHNDFHDRAHDDGHAPTSNYHTNDRVQQPVPVQTRASYQSRPNVQPAPHPTAATVRAPQRSVEQAAPVAHNVPRSPAAARAPVVEHNNASPAKVEAEHRNVAAKPAPASSEKSRTEHDGKDHDKDQH